MVRLNKIDLCITFVFPVVTFTYLASVRIGSAKASFRIFAFYLFVYGTLRQIEPVAVELARQIVAVASPGK